MFCVRKERSKGELGIALKVEVRIAAEDVNRAVHSDDAIRAVLLERRNARKLVMPRPAQAFALSPASFCLPPCSESKPTARCTHEESSPQPKAKTGPIKQHPRVRAAHQRPTGCAYLTGISRGRSRAWQAVCGVSPLHFFSGKAYP